MAAGILAVGACAAPPAAQPTSATETVTLAPTQTTSTTPTPTPTSTTIAPPTWADTVKAVGPSVARLDVLGCDRRWMGSGFVVGDHLLMTANHVAERASAITVQYNGGVTTARVVGLDPSTDSALLRTKDALPGAPLKLLDGLPRLGLDIGVLGFPLRTYELRFTKGTVSGQHARISLGGHEFDALVTDTAVNGGNSGGPAIDIEGNVLGLVSARLVWVVTDSGQEPADGQGFLVPSTDLIGNLSSWLATEPEQPARCGNTDPQPTDDSSINVKVNTDNPLAPEIARSLVVHGEAINWGSYDAAWQVFTPAMQRAMGSVEKWSSGLSSSVWTDLAVNAVTMSGDRASVGAVLVTTQDAADGHDGQTCSVWDMTYTMVNENGAWLIDKVKASPGSPTAC